MWYPLKVLAAPAAEPITLEEAKAQTREDGNASDTALRAYIAAARSFAEKYCGIVLAAQRVELACDSWADLGALPVAPIAEIEAIAYLDANGEVAEVAAEIYDFEADNLCPGIYLQPGQSWPTHNGAGRIKITAKAGFLQVPPDVKLALLMLVAHWHENRETAGRAQNEIPYGAECLLSNYRVYL